MNVANIPFADNPLGFWIVFGISALATGIGALILWKKKMF